MQRVDLDIFDLSIYIYIINCIQYIIKTKASVSEYVPCENAVSCYMVPIYLPAHYQNDAWNLLDQALSHYSFRTNTSNTTLNAASVHYDR